MFERKCKITFIAHGSTVNSEEKRLSDNEKYPPLNDAGEKEIERVAEWLRKKAIKNDVIYSSPSLRTVQTAQIISKVFKTDFVVLEKLPNRKRGIWSGLTFEQIEKKYPHMIELMHTNPTSFCPEGGECVKEFNLRVDKVIKKIVENNIGNRIIIVTHPSIIQAAISNAIGLPPENQAKVYIKTGSATQISYYDTWASLVYSGYVPL